MQFIWKYFGLSWLKKQLDKLPANNRKTIIGILIIILTIAAGFLPAGVAEILASVIVFLKSSYVADPVTTVGLSVGILQAAIGIVHKILKSLEELLLHAELKKVI